jgi:PAS domain S-box-containing protein
MDPETMEQRAAGWRRLAEERLAASGAHGVAESDNADSARMLQELLVHQVELQLQNEEMLESRTELEESNERFVELYDYAPVGYFSLSAGGLIVQLNYLGARMLCKERSLLLDCRFSDWLSPGSRQPFESFLSRVFSGEAAAPCEVAITASRASPLIVKLTGVLSPDGQVGRVAAMDVTEQRQAEAAARERNEDLNRIFNLATDIMGVCNMEGRLVRMNPAFERLIGFSCAELSGRSFFEFVHPDDLESTREAFNVFRKGGEVLEFVNRQRCRDGGFRWVEWRATAFRGDLICSLGRDITERKRTEDALRESEEKFRSIVESSPMAMYLYQLSGDDRLVLVGANPAADRETGIEHDALYGKTAEEAFPQLVGTMVPEMYKEVARGKLGSQSFVIRYDDERIAGHFEVRVFQTAPRAIVVAFMNVSERMMVEEELRRTREELESIVQHRTAQLQKRTLQLRALASELTQAEERERRRIAGLIHDDLQQTLVAASLNLTMLKSTAASESAATDLERVGHMLRDAIAMSRSLTSELSPPVLQQCGLSAAFQWLRTWCLEKYGLEVELDVEEDIHPGTESGVVLFRSVRELLFNIVKHAGVSSARLGMWRTRDGGVGIEVSDAGAGFDPLDVRAREGASGGFGLFSIRERLEMLGGTFDAESSPGHGSRFTLWVPAVSAPADVPAIPSARLAETPLMANVRPHPPAEIVEPTVPQLARRIRIIVADDHPAVRRSLARLLQTEWDLEVVGEAADGEQALRLARMLRPDFVVMDINMPGMDGIKSTAEISKSIPCVRVLGLSTDADGAHRTAMIRAGALDLLHKNDPTSGIVAMLRSHTEGVGCPFCRAD